MTDRHPIQQLAALAAYSLPDSLPDSDGRTTLAGRQCPLTPAPGLGVDSYACLLGAEPLEALRAPGAIIQVEVETPVGRRSVPRAVVDGATVPEL